MHTKKQGMAQGVAMLMLSSLIVKVIGAFFQVPLQNIIGGETSPTFGLFSTAYQIYTAMLVISTVGLPAALSKMVAEAVCCGKEREANRIMRVAACIFIPIGLAASLALYFGAGQFAEAIKNRDVVLAVQAISPSVLMVAILSVFRGYYQGRSNMYPTAISQIIEALGKLIVGLALAMLALRQGYSDAVVAAAAVLGVTIGEVAAVLYMMVQSVIAKKHSVSAAINTQTRSHAAIAKTLLGLAIPVTVSSAVMSLTNLIDVGLVSVRLQSTAIGLSESASMAEYGIYTSMAITFFNLPQTLVTALAVNVLPSIAGARAVGDSQKVNRVLSTTIRVTMMITIPCTVGFMLLSSPMLRLVFREGTALGGQLMALLGPAVPAVAMVAVTNAVLQGFGRIDLPLFSMFIGAVIKLVGDYILIGTPGIAILGAPISTGLCYWVIALFNLWHISRLSVKLESPVQTVVRPLAAAGGMAAVIFISHTLLLRVTAAAPASSADKMITVFCVLLAIFAYAVFLLLLGAVTREDLAVFPKGEWLANKLRMK